MVSAPPPIAMGWRGEGGGGNVNMKIWQNFVVAKSFLTFVAG